MNVLDQEQPGNWIRSDIHANKRHYLHNSGSMVYSSDASTTRTIDTELTLTQENSFGNRVTTLVLALKYFPVF